MITPSSKLLQNLQSVSNTPFVDPSAAEPTRIGSAPIENQSTPVSASTVTPQAFVPASGGIPSPQPFSAASIPKETPAAPVMTQASRSGLEPVAGRVANAGGRFSFLSRNVIFGILGVLVVLVGAVFAWNWWGNQQSASNPSVPGATSPTRQVTLTYWGLWEPESIMRPVIQKYEQQNPGVKIQYVQQNSRQYRQRLQAAIQDGSGPDIFRFHNTWMPMVQTNLSPAPSTAFSPSEIQQDFYPVVTQDLVNGSQVYGVPLMYEGMALLYNQNMLQAANALPPSDWQQVRELASRLTIRSGQRIDRAGIALGTADNVDHFSEILAMMMLQNSADLSQPVSANAQSALEFYTLFSRVDGVWDSTLPPSTQAFAAEQVAMIFAPSWRIHEIQELNPNLNIGVARVPQIDGTQVAWASYWAEGVSASSRQKEEAWKFLQYLSQPDQLRALHSDAGSVRGYGELYPRVSMAAELRTNPLLSAYLDDALYAQTWYLASDTFDEGLNDGMIQYYTDAVNSMNQSGNAERALQAILPGIQQVLSRYGLVRAGVAQ